MDGTNGIISLGAFIQAGFIILLAALVIAGLVYLFWHWNNDSPTYQCRKCSGVFQTADSSPMCPFCRSTKLYLRDLGGD